MPITLSAIHNISTALSVHNRAATAQRGEFSHLLPLHIPLNIKCNCNYTELLHMNIIQ